MASSSTAPPAEPLREATPAGSLDQAFRVLLEPINQTLVRIERAVTCPPATAGVERGRTIAEPAPAAPEPLRDATAAELFRRLERLQTSLRYLCEQLALEPESCLPIEALPPEPASETRGGQAATGWEQIVLDDQFATEPKQANSRQRFLRDVWQGNAAARILAGQLMIIRAAEQSELPEMLRHVGEAYYRWCPRTVDTPQDPLEPALAQWLNQRVQKAGLPNSIQLVQPGERFDSTRHNATSRGVEVIEVGGWVVLRDRTKVYTRANVTLR